VPELVLEGDDVVAELRAHARLGVRKWERG
jgi:hypothetical protein